MVGQPAEGTDTPEIRTEKIFHAMDENGDGVLTREEFVKSKHAQHDAAVL